MGRGGFDGRGLLEELYRRYKYLCLKQISGFVSERWQAEDLLQDTFVQIAGKLELLDTLSENQRAAYLAVTARNTAISFLRRSGRVTELPLDDDIPSPAPGIEEAALKRLDIETLREVWLTLDPGTREILEYKYMLKLTDAEIADRLGVKESSVRMLLTRARRRALKLFGNISSPFSS